MDRDPRTKELADLKEALTNFEHQLDLFEARLGHRPEETQVVHLESGAPQIAFANDIVAAMKNRMSEDCPTPGMRQGRLF